MIHARDDYNRIQDPEGKIGEDEPVLLFRAKDKHFQEVLSEYSALLESDTDMDDKEREKMRLSISSQIYLADNWQRNHGCKTPDIP
jgi:hypothetical protein